MTSKLFHAVVCAGIALGTSSLGCFGAVAPDVEDDGDLAEPGPDAGGAAADARVVRDAAPRDALAAAFCDASWPTTKANRGPATCIDPRGDCADAGPPQRCVKVSAPGVCDLRSEVATSCAARRWQCPSGTTLRSLCRCWAGMACADAGSR